MPSFHNAKTYFVTADAPTSLGALLSHHFPNLSTDTIIQSGGVWLGKTRMMNPTYMVSKGQTAKVLVCATQGKRYQLDVSQIVLETKSFLVVNKPAGITSVPDRSNQFYNLTSGVIDYLKASGNGYHTTPVGRLDFMVSGLMIFPKSKQAEKAFFQLVQTGKIGKLYRARVETKDGLPDCLRVKDKLEFTAKAKISDHGKSAHSLFIKRQTGLSETEYSVILLTGRRHQIRIHAAHYLSPLINETLYPNYVKKTTDAKPIKLVCYGYNFVFQKQRYKIRLSELPTYF